MPISKIDVEKITELARLDLTSEESESFAEQLTSIIGYIDKLNELETSDVIPMSHCSTAHGDTEYTQRDDISRTSLGARAATENARDSEAGFFKVPRVIGG